MNKSRLFLWLLSGAFLVSVFTTAFGENKPENPKKKEAVKEKSKDKPKDKQKDKEKPKEDSVYNSGLVGGLKFRSIGPAFCSGRIADFAVNPENHSEWYVAVASGHVWKQSTTVQPSNLFSTTMAPIPSDAW